jgi:hypothetical protein
MPPMPSPIRRRIAHVVRDDSGRAWFIHIRFPVGYQLQTSSEIAALKHKIGNDTMERAAFVVKLYAYPEKEQSITVRTKGQTEVHEIFE